MFHFKRNLHRHFHKALVFTFVVPRGLIDELLDAVLFNGVGVIPRMDKKIAEQGSGRLRVAVQNVFANEVFISGLEESLLGLLVHIDDFPVFLAYGNGKSRLFYVILAAFHNACFYAIKVK